MQRKNLIVFAILAAFVVVLAATGISLYHALFDGLQNLPEGTKLSETPSPSSSYSVAVYRVSNDKMGDAVRGELWNKQDGKRSNIFWQIGQSDATVTWSDDTTVSINGILLDVETDTYDWRDHAEDYLETSSQP